MEPGSIAQIVSVVLAALAIVWHQQRSTNTLRSEVRSDIGEVRSMCYENGLRLARIEGSLGMGVRGAAAADSPGQSADPTA